MLNLLDCEATSFFDARITAKTLLSGKRPDLLVLDINLPEVTGLDLLEFLRRRPEWKNMPAIMLSSEAADTVADQALAMSADVYVMKPITIEELEMAMSQALYKHVNT